MNEPFKVGDRVTVIDSSWSAGGIKRITTVERVLKTKIELKSGDAFEPNGFRLYGFRKSHWYRGPSVRHYEEGDSERLEKERIVYQAELYKEWSAMTLDDLRVVNGLMEKYAKRGDV